MTIAQRQRFVLLQAIWMLGALLMLAATSALSLDLFFVCALLGILIIFELTSPVNLTPQWRTRLRWVIVIGMAGFGYIILRQVFAILPSGLI
jgi:hypothetical protein